MHSFWTAEISRKGVLTNLVWTGPQSRPKISRYPDYDTYYEKQRKITRLTLRFKRNVSSSSPFRGSITIEAAFAVPMFLFFCIQLLSVISLIQLHSTLEAALHQETAQAALEAYVYDELGMDMGSATGTFLENTYLRAKVIERAGKEYLDHSMIEGGSNGISILFTRETGDQDVIDIVLSYRVKPAVDLLGFSGFTMANRCCMKAWTGYQPEEQASSEDGTEELVYITETGTVYHKSRNCSHLALSIRSVSTESVNVLRNENGAKYYPCEGCGSGAGSSVYVTDQGNRYHTSLDCSGLKRTIYTVPISETGGRGPCSRCSATG